MKNYITEAIIAEYEETRGKENERLELVLSEFGPLQYWEELHFMQEQILKRYNIGGK